MQQQLKDFIHLFIHAGKNLLPIVLVVAFFQIFVLAQAPDNLVSILLGLLIVMVGVALFLQGLELGIFPIAKSLSNDFARRGNLFLLLAFGFAIGFSAVIAEPALIAVAMQAEIISEGRVDAFTLRLIVALSVGLVVALGVFRTILGHPIHWYLIGGYIVVLTVTFFAPEEIVGLAYDSGGVTTNIVTVPLIAALGIGLAASIKGRNPLTDGFGLVALAVMVPMITVQLYGIAVYTFGDTEQVAQDLDALTSAAAAAAATHPLWQMLKDIGEMLRDVTPIILVILLFQYLIIKKPIPHIQKVVAGFAMVIIGLYAFVVGLKMGLFPIGSAMAEQLIGLEGYFWLYLFAFAIGFATTMAEPALIAVGQQAEEAAHGKLNGQFIRMLVAFGVAIGITIGVHRIITGDSIHHYIMVAYVLVVILTALSPKYIIALAFDLGGVTTSEVTVPLVTALGIGLATHIEGRSVLIDGFGLIAFASIFPIVTVMIYAIIVELKSKLQKKEVPT